MNLRFGSILDLSTKDYPGKTASVVFLGGCPLACGYCFTPLLVKQDTCVEAPTQFFLSHFLKQKDFIDAVVFTGGEPLMQGNALLELVPKLKDYGFLVKIDSSGYYAESLADLVPLVDYIAMDIKTRLDKDAYGRLTGSSLDSEILLSNVLRSLTFLESKGRGVFKEFRTTVVPGENDDFDTIKQIANAIRGFCDLYAIQEFDSSKQLVEPSFKEKPALEKEKLLDLARVAKSRGLKDVVLRTVKGGEEKV